MLGTVTSLVRAAGQCTVTIVTIVTIVTDPGQCNIKLKLVWRPCGAQGAHTHQEPSLTDKLELHLARL